MRLPWSYFFSPDAGSRSLLTAVFFPETWKLNYRTSSHRKKPRTGKEHLFMFIDFVDRGGGWRFGGECTSIVIAINFRNFSFPCLCLTIQILMRSKLCFLYSIPTHGPIPCSLWRNLTIFYCDWNDRTEMGTLFANKAISGGCNLSTAFRYRLLHPSSIGAAIELAEVIQNIYVIGRSIDQASYRTWYWFDIREYVRCCSCLFWCLQDFYCVVLGWTGFTPPFNLLICYEWYRLLYLFSGLIEKKTSTQFKLVTSLFEAVSNV